MHPHITSKISKKTKIFAISILSIFIMGGVFFTTVYALNRGEASVQGIQIGPHQVGRMAEEDVKTLLRQKVEEHSDTPLILKTDSGTEINALPSELGASYDLESTVENIFSYGKTGRIDKKIMEQTKALFVGVEIPFSITMDEKKYSAFVENNLSDINNPAKNARYSYNEETEAFDFIPAESGIVVNDEAMRSDIRRNLERLTSETVTLHKHTDEPVVSSIEDTVKAKEQAEEIISNLPYSIQSRSTQWEIEKEDIISWLEFVPKKDESTGEYKLTATLSEKEIHSYLAGFAPGLNIPAKDARFAMKDGRVDAFSLAEKGYELNIEKSTDSIIANILDQKKESALVFDEIEPAISNESIDTLGITSLVGRGESDFKGSPSSRKHNIQVGADKYQGLLIAPGEVFSFNENLGPVTAAEGYLPELVIKNNRTIPEYGGGLCQVSTTLFRAAVYGGLEITERYNHSYPVAYYGTPGFDATIYPMHPDLRFKNNTEGHLLIQYEISGTKLIFEIYGKDDGRKTEVDGPHLYDQQRNGAVKAWLTQTVYNDSGNVMHEKTFYSNYKSPSLYPVTSNPLE